MLGRYVLMAIHDPKHYPKEPIGTFEKEEKTTGNEMTIEDEAKISALLGAFGGQTIKSSSDGEKALKTAKNEATGP